MSIEHPPGAQPPDIAERLRLILPALYQDRADEVQPVSMGSAGLKFGPDGNVAWDQIWGSFCDLALAGGPPHRGTLLVPRTPDPATTSQYQAVQAELCRGIHLVTGLFAEPAPDPGWVTLYCTSAGMASWMARAIVAENVSARAAGLLLHLPAGPAYRVERETKNVITSVAKTCHYWREHTPLDQQDAIALLFRQMNAASPLIAPGNDGIAEPLAHAITAATGLQPSPHACAGWLGLRCPSVRTAVWMMRVLIVLNLFSRREADIVFVPLNSTADPGGAVVLRAVTEAHAYIRAQQLL